MPRPNRNSQKALRSYPPLEVDTTSCARYCVQSTNIAVQLLCSPPATAPSFTRCHLISARKAGFIGPCTGALSPVRADTAAGPSASKRRITSRVESVTIMLTESCFSRGFSNGNLLACFLLYPASKLCSQSTPSTESSLRTTCGRNSDSLRLESAESC